MTEPTSTHPKSPQEELFNHMSSLYKRDVWLLLDPHHVKGLPEHVLEAHKNGLLLRVSRLDPRPITMIPKSEGLHLRGVSFSQTHYDLVVPWWAIATVLLDSASEPAAVFSFRMSKEDSKEEETTKPRVSLRAIPGGSK